MEAPLPVQAIIAGDGTNAFKAQGIVGLGGCVRMMYVLLQTL